MTRAPGGSPSSSPCLLQSHTDGAVSALVRDGAGISDRPILPVARGLRGLRPGTITLRKTTMADIDLSRLNIDQLTALVGNAQTEVATRGKQRRKELRSELERRIAADGYKLGDIFPELGSGAASGSQRQKRPAKYRNPQSPDQTWSGIGRTPKWVQAILGERGIDMAAFKSIPMYRVSA